jgi:alkanesulfonate monooxygenase SsuD/methylene tetrahydromethanopterin reductase-like flavin-dependent oxidoreductase (luciferase family)
MFRGERPTIDGQHYSVHDAINSPAPITPGGPPIMIGGQGEKKTLRLMAEHAEMANFTSGFDDLPHKLELLAAHCDAVGRDYSTINKTPLASLFLGETHEAAIAKVDARLAGMGMSWASLDDTFKQQLGARFLLGDADEVGEQVANLKAIGMDGVTVNLPSDGCDTEAIAHAGAVLQKALA